MKILQVIQRVQNRGAETFASQLSNHLIEYGHEVRMLALFPGDAILSFKGEIKVLGASSRIRFIDIQAWKEISEIVNSFNPDIIQANAGDTLKYLILSKKIFGWKGIIVSRNASQIGKYLKGMFQKKFNGFLYRNVDAVASVSRASQQDILYNFPFLERTELEVIPIGLEKKELSDVSLESGKTKNIIHVGGFTFEKNHQGVLNIFCRLLEKNSNVHLHLIGDGPLKNTIIQKVHENGLTSKITFYGFISNPLPLIKAADVLILPSIIEGLPGVILEAMFMETPVVAYDVGGISEILNDGNGYLIDPGNEKEFVKAVDQSLRSPDHLMIKNAKEMVNRDYMNKKIARDFLSFYEKILGAKNCDK
ncbi:glycosyltransferase [Salinimicrobium oceani]|uniref:Glycosyltransferase n=1 Tax=Salinimicrobium oceani TaxID=2722702 RepID=A0ABX1CYU6_9FLAO|nr:glycosyltransferase [Salinimicrobium oceani]NJW53436.1 glycosyltransferase [Salinimicrobium oceani]